MRRWAVQSIANRNDVQQRDIALASFDLAHMSPVDTRFRASSQMPVVVECAVR